MGRDRDVRLLSPLRVAHFSPLPPQRSGIADYCAELLPYLAAEMEVDVYVDDSVVVSDRLARALTVRPIAEFLGSPKRRAAADACVYHMGNQPLYHESIYAALMRHPGITVLHEFDLHGFHMNRIRAYGPANYAREMGYAYGRPGASQARQVVSGQGEAPAAHCPLFHRVADVSLGVIVHTEYAKQLILAASPRTRVAHVPLAASLPQPIDSVSRPDWLKQLPVETLVLASFGYIAPSKRIDSVLRALARLRAEASNFQYVLVGEHSSGCDLMPLIHELGLGDVVHVTGFVGEDEFRAYLDAIDVGISLRSGPTGGEMSAGLVRLLAHGRPTLVSDVGGFTALPNECVIKIPQGPDEVDRLAEALRELIRSGEARAAYGAAARRYVERELSFPRVAEQYSAFVQECLQSILETRFFT